MDHEKLQHLYHCFRRSHVLKVKERKKVKLLSHVPLFATPWTVAYQPPLSMGFSKQEYWSGLPFPSPGDLGLNPGLNPGSEPGSPALQADALPSEPPSPMCLELHSFQAQCVLNFTHFTNGKVFLTV